MGTAEAVSGRLGSSWPTVFDQLEPLVASDDEAARLRQEVVEVVQHHELADPLVERLGVLERQAVALLGRLAQVSQETDTRKPPEPGYTRVDTGHVEHLKPDDAETRLEDLRALVVRDAAHRLTLTWVVEREDDST